MTDELMNRDVSKIFTEALKKLKIAYLCTGLKTYIPE